MPPKAKETGTIQQVWDGKFSKTRKGLTKSDLMLSKTGKVMSIAAYEKREEAKRERKRIKCAEFAESERKRTSERNASPRPEIQVARDVPVESSLVILQEKPKKMMRGSIQGFIPPKFIMEGEKSPQALTGRKKRPKDAIIYDGKIYNAKSFERYFSDGHSERAQAKIRGIIEQYMTLPNSAASDKVLFDNLANYADGFPWLSRN
jgi:hypothetical protein